MGKGRDKRRKKEDPEKATKRAARQAQKLLKHEQKISAGDDNHEGQVGDDGGGKGASVSTAIFASGFNNEEAIETTLHRLQRLERKVKVVEEVPDVEPPSPRVNVIFLPHPSREHELVIFGGEYWNGAVTQTYNDTYFYNVKKSTWARLSSAVNPPPRSSSQGVNYKQYMIIFGGEFVSQSQSQYLHFRDVWRYDGNKSEWEEMKNCKNGPSSRSGHRMVLWKREAVMFGGFYDNALECHYYNDLWLLKYLDATPQWHSVKVAATGDSPAPRSGHNMAVYQDTLFVFGGYSTEKFNRFKKSEATVHHDLWMISLASSSTQSNNIINKQTGAVSLDVNYKNKKEQQQEEFVGSSRSGGNDNTTVQLQPVWKRIKLSGIPPPIRAGVASYFRDKRLYLFGGVVDIESPGGSMVSTFCNDLFVFHMDSQKFYPIVLRPSASRESVPICNSAAPIERDKEARSKHLSSLAEELKALQLEKKTNEHQDRQVANINNNNDDNDDDDDDKSSIAEVITELKQSYEVNKAGVLLPHRRMDAAITISNNWLYIFGGQFESGEKEITMSDLFALNLSRLDNYHVLLSHDLSRTQWLGAASENDANSWESGSTVVSAAFDFDYNEDNNNDEVEDEDEDDNNNDNKREDELLSDSVNHTHLKEITPAMLCGGLTKPFSTMPREAWIDSERDNGDDAPTAIPAELPNEVTPSRAELGMCDGVIHRKGKKGLKVHKEQLLAQLGASSLVPTPVHDETFDAFHRRTVEFWERTACEANDNLLTSQELKTEATAFARRRYNEARQLLKQLKLVEERERAEREFFRERQREKERMWQEQDQENDDNSDGNDEKDEKKIITQKII